MMKKVDKVFIGKYLERDAALVNGANITTVASNIAEGEIVILNENYQVLVGAGSTFANSKKIYIAEGSAEVFNTTNPNGTALTGRRLIISGAIDGTRVVNYTGDAFSAKSEAVATLPAISDTIVAGTEYVLKFVFKGDISAQHPGQDCLVYRYVAKSGDTSSDIYDAFVSRVNKGVAKYQIKKNYTTLVTAVNNAGTLELTALPVPSCTTSVDDIDEFTMNNFNVYLNYVDSDYNWQEVNLTSAKTYTPFDRGYGQWETIRDIEKHALAYEGITNYTHFPVIKPSMRTVKNAEYDQITIEHDRVYRSADMSYNKETSLVECIALAKGTGATTPQNAEILATLNTWMASLPKSFANVSFA